MGRYVKAAVWAGIAAAVCAALPTLLIREGWRIAQAAVGEEIGAIVRQLQEAALTLPVWVYIAVFAAVGLLKLIPTRRRRLISFAAVIIIIAGVGAALMYTKVNGIPVITVARIALDLMRSGAF